MPDKSGAPHGGQPFYTVRAFCGKQNLGRSWNSLPPSILNFPDIQKETPAYWLVFLFGGDTQIRTGGGAFAERFLASCTLTVAMLPTIAVVFYTVCTPYILCGIYSVHETMREVII